MTVKRHLLLAIAYFLFAIGERDTSKSAFDVTVAQPNRVQSGSL